MKYRNRQAVAIFSISLFSIFVNCDSYIQIENSVTGQYFDMLYSNGTYNKKFIDNSSTFNCSIDNLFTYTQNCTQPKQNTQNCIQLNNMPYSILFYNMQSPVSINLSTVYNLTKFSIVNQNCTNVNASLPFNCTYNISNGCSQPISIFNYFDRVILNISGYQTMTYNILCDQKYLNPFQYGNLLLVLYCTILLMIVPIYSRGWSIKGQGITMNIWIIIGVEILVIILGVIGYFLPNVLNYIAIVLSWLGSIIGVGFCLNQTLFLTKNKYLLKGFILFNKVPCRFIELISLLFGIGVTCAWFFLQKNWIINDIIFTCFTIFIIKVFKFTSLRVAIFTFVIVIVTQFIVIFVIYYHGKESYSNLLLNSLNFPFQLQFPTINPVINQKCAWLPNTSVIFPGMLFSYFRRFDTSRNTRLYLVIGICVFIIGSLAWVLLSIVVLVPLPFGFITEPAEIVLVAIFAYQRKQIHTIWYGRFYDQQFADKEAIKALEQSIQFEKRGSDLSKMRPSIINGLQINNIRESSLAPSAFRQAI